MIDVRSSLLKSISLLLLASSASALSLAQAAQPYDVIVYDFKDGVTRALTIGNDEGEPTIMVLTCPGMEPMTNLTKCTDAQPVLKVSEFKNFVKSTVIAEANSGEAMSPLSAADLAVLSARSDLASDPDQAKNVARMQELQGDLSKVQKVLSVFSTNQDALDHKKNIEGEIRKLQPLVGKFSQMTSQASAVESRLEKHADALLENIMHNVKDKTVDGGSRPYELVTSENKGTLHYMVFTRLVGGAVGGNSISYKGEYYSAFSKGVDTAFFLKKGNEEIPLGGRASTTVQPKVLVHDDEVYIVSIGRENGLYFRNTRISWVRVESSISSIEGVSSSGGKIKVRVTLTAGGRAECLIDTASRQFDWN